MKKCIFVLSVLLLVFGLFLPVCRADSPWTGCVSDTHYPNVNYNYIVEQVGSGDTAYATIRGTVTSFGNPSDAFPGTMGGYIASKTSDIYFTVVYGNNTGSRYYVIDRFGKGQGISWAEDATGALSEQVKTIQIGDCTSPTCSPLGRWCDMHDGTVIDTTTGLVWLKDAGWGGNDNWHGAGMLATQVMNGNPSWLTDGSKAEQWRLPSRVELEAIMHGTEAIRASSMYLFTGVQSHSYWTSDAWTVSMSDGYVHSGNKGSDYFDVWPVRGGQ
ncbi:MAG: DUF1566 domain-containing protein [Deltaproteobacteria bacterium]|nr:DUF1566 domain-containing protein [Deltaproteobacteria bacterium]